MFTAAQHGLHRRMVFFIGGGIFTVGNFVINNSLYKLFFTVVSDF